MMFRKKLHEYEIGPLLGMRSIIVKGLMALVCPKCKTDSVMIDGAMLDSLHERLLLYVVSDSHLLGGEEARFIRKGLELSQADFAKRLGVKRVTVARWETGETPIDGPTSLAIRSLAAVPFMADSAHAKDREAIKQAFSVAPTGKAPKTLAVIEKVRVGDDPNGITYDPHSHRVFSADRGSKRMTAIDVKSGKIVATSPYLAGRTEHIAVEGKGTAVLNMQDLG
jgi:DNA-binding transcriptional regulator YiaG